MHTSYSSLGRDFKNIFEELFKHLNSQYAEADVLRKQLTDATTAALQSERYASKQLQLVLDEERKEAAIDREKLLSQITSLVNATGSAQDERISNKIEAVRHDMTTATKEFETANAEYKNTMDVWSRKEGILIEEVLKSRDTLKQKMKKDWIAVNEQNTSIHLTAKSVHEETVRIVDAQMQDMAVQMQALDDFVRRARSQNESHNASHIKSLQGLASTVKSSYTNTQERLRNSKERIQAYSADMTECSRGLCATIPPLDSTLRQPLSSLREYIMDASLTEYVSTGETPQKTLYQYPTSLPRTEPYERLLASAIHSPHCVKSSELPDTAASPSKSIIYTDAQTEDIAITRPASMDGGLREVSLNINAGIPRSAELSTNMKPELEKQSLSSSLMGLPPLKRHATMDSKLPQKFGGGKGSVVKLEGRENVPPSGGRRLRSSPTG